MSDGAGERAAMVAGLAALASVGVFCALAFLAGGVRFVSPRGLGLPVEPFGTIVVAGVFVGAAVLRRYGARHGISADDARNLTLWIVVTGAIGAHVFEVLLYERSRLAGDPWLLVRLWDGISSYGGFIGGALGWATFVRWKRLPPGVVADTVVLGLLVAFSIGRIGCTLIHDHVGAATTSWMATDYPRAELARRGLLAEFPGAGELVRAHNLGLYELLFLIPLNAVVLALAFASRRALPAGLLAALVGLAYAPARFALEFLRLDVSDPRYAGLTFAQWCSFLAFAASLAVILRLRVRGAGTEPPHDATRRRERRPAR